MIREVSPKTRVLLISGVGWISPEAAKAAGASRFHLEGLERREVANAVRMVGRGMTVFAREAGGAGDPALAPRARGPRPDRRGHQPRDRKSALPLPAHREGSHCRPLPEARSSEPRRGGTQAEQLGLGGGRPGRQPQHAAAGRTPAGPPNPPERRAERRPLHRRTSPGYPWGMDATGSGDPVFGTGRGRASSRELVERRPPRPARAGEELVGDDPFERIAEGTAFAQPAVYCASIAGATNGSAARGRILRGPFARRDRGPRRRRRDR